MMNGFTSSLSIPALPYPTIFHCYGEKAISLHVHRTQSRYTLDMRANCSLDAHGEIAVAKAPCGPVEKRGRKKIYLAAT